MRQKWNASKLRYKNKQTQLFYITDLFSHKHEYTGKFNVSQTLCLYCIFRCMFYENS